MDDNTTRREMATQLYQVAFSFLKNKFYHKTIASFSEVKLRKDLRVDVLCLTYDDDVVIVEIKSCRDDFLKDNKWQKYLNYCNYFYFICPENEILQSEIPNNVGLIYFDKAKDNKKNYNIVREAMRLKGVSLTNSWFKFIYKKLAFRAQGDVVNDFIMNKDKV